MLNTPANRSAVRTLLGIARSYTRTFLVPPRDATALALRLEPLLIGRMNGEIVVALTILLLKALGVADAFDESRLVE